jgi:His/Glu/Gln/Arg/opine family amino acid ABC transporter permease subunit
VSSVHLGLAGYGLLQTVLLTLGGLMLGVAFAVAAGLARLCAHLVVRAVAFCYVELCRAAPVLVLALWFIFALPAIGVRLDQLFAGTLALALHVSGYTADIVRDAVVATRPEPGANIGPARRMLRYTGPRIAAAMVEPFAGRLLDLLKSSALVSVAAIAELTLSGQLILGGNDRTIAVFCGLLAGYVLLGVCLSAGLRRLVRLVGGRPVPSLLDRVRAAAR